MELIIEFYKSLDTLNLIIFWGIIVIIILLIIFSSIMINKNRRIKKKVITNHSFEEEIPIKIEDKIITQNVNEDKIKDIEKNQIETKEEINNQEITNNHIEEEKFIAEEHVISFQQENNPKIQKEINKEKEAKKEIEMPTGPYQRNVLREMSLSQTSPIGINRRINNEEKKNEMISDLEKSLVSSQEEIIDTKKEIPETNYHEKKLQEVNLQIKTEPTNIEKSLPRRTEIKQEIHLKNNQENVSEKKQQVEFKQPYPKEIENKIDLISKKITNINETTTNKEENISNKNYLEEVSRKLAEAEIPDEIERTNYELQQEEDAIISYKELMEKKDSIQTIDEEEAIISIEELMNRKNTETEKEDDSKLYNLTESEKNEDFIKELKQFRNDLY